MTRYGVHSVTGYPLTPGGGLKCTYWYVHDKANCHNVVAAWESHYRDGEERARRLCRRLNDDERRWERETNGA